MFLRPRAGYVAATQLGRQTVTVDKRIIELACARFYAFMLSDALDLLACRHQVVVPRSRRFDDSLVLLAHRSITRRQSSTASAQSLRAIAFS